MGGRHLQHTSTLIVNKKRKKMENKQESNVPEFDINEFVAKKEQECTEKINEVLKEYNCRIKSEFVISESGISPILKTVFIK